MILKKKIIKVIKLIIIIWIALIILLIFQGISISFQLILGLLAGITFIIFILSALLQPRTPEEIARDQERKYKRRKEEEFRKRERIRAEEWHRAKRRYEDDRDKPFGDNPFG